MAVRFYAPALEQSWVEGQGLCYLRGPWWWFRWTVSWWPTSSGRRSASHESPDPQTKCRTSLRNSDPGDEKWQPEKKKEKNLKLYSRTIERDGTWPQVNWLFLSTPSDNGHPASLRICPYFWPGTVHATPVDTWEIAPFWDSAGNASKPITWSSAKNELCEFMNKWYHSTQLLLLLETR